MIQEKDLIILNKKHIRLVEDLKKVLLVGQMGFLKAGEILTTIKQDQTYKSEDSDIEWTWKQFIGRADLPFPGRTPESRRRTADALIRIYRLFQERYLFPSKTLAPVGWTKLDLIAPLCEKAKDDKEVKDWIEKAKQLSVSDLYAEIKNDGKDTFSQVTCNHEEELPYWKCPACGAHSLSPMNSKHKEIKESCWKNK
jgi:hypothetical protein